MEIGLERAPVGHDPGRDIEATGLDQALDALRRKGAAPLNVAQGIGHGMTGALTSPRARQSLAPPLQADGAELGLGHLLGDAGELDIEGVERKKIGAGLARREQSGKGAIGIA